MTWDNPFKGQAIRESYERHLRIDRASAIEFRERIEGACIAMSRFMTFVYLEADANPPERAACDPHLATERRLWALGHVLERGMLRLEWPR